MTFIKTTLLLLLVACSSYSQKNYFRYHHLVNSAEEAFVKKEMQQCYKFYDSCFREYKQGYVKDYYIAAQIAFFNKDTNRFLHYMRGAFEHGFPLEALGAAPLMKNIKPDDELGRKVQALSEKYSFSVNKVLRDSVYYHLYGELIAVNNVDLGEEYYRTAKETTQYNVDYLVSLLNANSWPSEKLIGIYTDGDFDELKKRLGLTLSTQKAKKFNSGGASFSLGAPIPTSHQLFNYATFIPLLHDPCKFNELKEQFWRLVEKGAMHPKDYVMLEEWSADSVDPLISPTSCENMPPANRYNVIGRRAVFDEQGLKTVTENRKKRWIQKFEIDQQKKAIGQKEGLQFFFGFLHYR